MAGQVERLQGRELLSSRDALSRHCQGPSHNLIMSGHSSVRRELVQLPRHRITQPPTTAGHTMHSIRCGVRFMSHSKLWRRIRIAETGCDGDGGVHMYCTHRGPTTPRHARPRLWNGRPMCLSYCLASLCRGKGEVGRALSWEMCLMNHLFPPGDIHS